MPEKPHKAPCQLFLVGNLTFPDGQDPPSHASKPAADLLITYRVTSKLRSPEVRSGFRDAISCSACVLVPKTPVDENHGTPTFKHEIGGTRQLALV
jgi:hypothetical protein